MTTVKVADNADTLREDADKAARLHSATGWELAAYVHAWTYETKGGRPPETGKKVDRFSCTEFSQLGVRGLSSKPSVTKYRRAWSAAIEQGLVTEVEPGDEIDLPEEDFKEFVEALKPEPKNPKREEHQQQREKETSPGDSGGLPPVDEIPEEDLGEPVAQVEVTRVVDRYVDRVESATDGVEKKFPGLVGASLHRLGESLANFPFEDDPRRSYLHAMDALSELVAALGQTIDTDR